MDTDPTMSLPLRGGTVYPTKPGHMDGWHRRLAALNNSKVFIADKISKVYTMGDVRVNLTRYLLP